MAASTQGDSPTPDDLRRGSVASLADSFEDASSTPATPTPDDPQHGEDDSEKQHTAEGTDNLAGADNTASSSPPSSTPHVAAASTSSLNLPLKDPELSLEPPAASQEELVAALRTQIVDLGSQVTSLNSKLVKSYTTRGELEDDLHDRIESERALRQRVAELEKDKRRWEAEIETGGWVEKNHVQGEMQRLMSKVVEETKSRETAVQAHSALETEIESLTSNLFSEANKMVAFERLARARAEEKTRSVEEAGISMQALLEEVQVGLKDTIGKLEKRDAEVADLKKRLAAHGEHVEEEVRDGEDSADGDVGGIMFSDGEHLTPVITKSLTQASAASIATPSHLSAPRLLTSVLPYHEFLQFITYLRQLRVTALTRPPEVNYSHAYRDQQTIYRPSPAQLLAPHLLLSTHLSQPFMKRCVEEDSDPALRLDIAPGLGFLSRRSVGTGIVDGTLLIEPLHAGAELPSDRCALCGCDLELWLPNSGHLTRPKSTTPANAVNQTMRKMLGSSLFGRTNSSSNLSSSVTSSAPTSVHSTSSSTDSFTFPAAHEKASHHPHDAALQVHLFRAGDNASQRYPICPSYCLTRLRAVCEFWTYVRVIERGLLLEERFRFAQGGEAGAPGGGGGGGTESRALSRQPSFVRGATPSAAATPTAEKATEGLGLGPVGDHEHADVQARDFEAEDTEDGADKEKEKKDETVKIVEPEAEKDGSDLGGQKATDDDEEKKPSSASSTPSTSSGASPDPSSVTASLPKPARPARSSARNSPAIGSNPSPPSSPRLSSGAPPALPPRRVDPKAAPPLPQRNASTSSLGGFDSSSNAADIVGSAVGWEDRCWSEVVRLKESVFWTRVAAIAPDGGAVSSRGAKVWMQ
ncbi:hypothetical protein JCM10207_006718 [Rhodosporidiobolus poonsookiae]